MCDCVSVCVCVCVGSWVGMSERRRGPLGEGVLLRATGHHDAHSTAALLFKPFRGATGETWAKIG